MKTKITSRALLFGALRLALALAPVDALAGEAGWHKVTVEPALACKRREDLDQIISLKISGDKVALDKMLVATVMTGACTAFKRGETVYMESVASWGTLAKVRRRGEAVTYWVDAGHID